MYLISLRTYTYRSGNTLLHCTAYYEHCFDVANRGSASEVFSAEGWASSFLLPRRVQGPKKKPQCLSLVAKMLLQNARVFNPVHVAAYHTGNFNMIRLLLERGADPNLADEYGNTPLRYATDHTNIVNRLSK